MSEERESQPNWIFAIATVLLAITVGLFVQLLIAVLGRGLGGSAFIGWVQSSPSGLAVAAATGQLALFGLVWLRASMVPSLRDDVLHSLRNRHSHWFASLLFILGIGPFANACGMAIAKLTHSNLDAMQYVGVLIRRATVSEFLFLGLVLTVLPAVVEESLFRGLVFRSLRGLRVSVAILVQALAFGVFHLDLAQGFATAILGLGFGFIAFTTGSLAGSMVAHGGYNLTVLLSQRWFTTSDGELKWQALEISGGLLVATLAAFLLRRTGRQTQ